MPVRAHQQGFLRAQVLGDRDQFDAVRNLVQDALKRAETELDDIVENRRRQFQALRSKSARACSMPRNREYR